jgi:pimeloyl-ACP methyl ester carboxylesterase
MIRRIAITLTAIVGLTAGAPLVAHADIWLHPCVVKGAGAALCGRFRVFENRTARRGRTIALNVVLFPSYDIRHRVDALATLAGGPGEGAAAELTEYYTRAQIEHIRRRHALLFVDSRGTGSSGALDCPIRSRDPQAYLQGELFGDRGFLAACRRRLAQRADLRWYTTDPTVDDLDDVRRAAGFDKLTLLGTSGGTLTAAVYARRHPEHVRAIVIGGVSPTSARIPLEYAPARQNAIDGLFARCTADAACHAAYPDLKREFASVLARLRRGPVRTWIGVDGRHRPVTLGFAAFAERIGKMLYGADSARRIPYVIDAAYRSDWSPSASAGYRAERYLTLPPFGISAGYYFSTTCAEGVPFITARDLREHTAATFQGDTRVQMHRRACAIWNVPPVSRRFLEPVRSNAPTLMISGKYDPATPWWTGHAILPGFSRGRQIIDPNTGHLDDWDCFQSMALPFIDDPDPLRVNDACTHHVMPLKFVLPQRHAPSRAGAQPANRGTVP